MLPMEALPERDENVIYFLTDRRGLREDDIEIYPEVYLTFVYPAENVFLGLTGKAFVVDDVDCAEGLWQGQCCAVDSPVIMPEANWPAYRRPAIW